LAAFSAGETLRRADIEASAIDEVIWGCARQAGVGPNVARQVGYRCGCPVDVPAFTINKACGSGLKAIVSAYQAIALGDAELILAGGVESMSNIPYFAMHARWGCRLGHNTLVDAMYKDGYDCPLCEEVMGGTAENLADKYAITRQEADEYALQSQQRCAAAQAEGSFTTQCVAIPISGKQGKAEMFDTDEHPRPQTTLEGLAKLKPIFRENGTVHAGNASGITDGAASMLVLSENKAKELGVTPEARIVGYAAAGVEPSLMGVGPVPAIQKLLAKNNLTLQDIDLIELNEAFAVQVLACERELKFDMDRVNVHGGAIALGHPTGCTGTRIVVTLIHAMKQKDATLGLATLCISGGMGMAVLIERV